MVVHNLTEARDRINLLEEAMASSSCGITIADATLPDLPLIYANKAFERITGYPVEEILGKNCRFLQNGSDNSEALAKIHQALDNKTSVTVILENFRKDGTRFWNQLHLAPVYREGVATHFVGVQTDVTEEVEAKRALHENQVLLEKSNEELREANNQKEKLLGMAAHDLRSPLASIRSLLDLVLDSGKRETRQMLEMARTVANNSLQLVNDLLDLSAIRKGRVDMVKKEVKLNEFLETFEGIARQQARAKDITFRLRNHSGRETPHLDTSRISQVLNNLLSNAIKFSDRGSTVALEAGENDGQLILEMKDEGRGIPREDLPKLFGEFEKTSVSPTENESSSGLGLSIVKRLVELHGGTVEVESEVGKGSCFRVILDL